MKKPSPKLFELIKSLSREEKRYFTLFAQRHRIGTNNNYLKLFKAIDRQKSYDETILRKQLKDETFVPHLSTVKRYLYQMLLKSLRDYYSTNSVNARLLALLHDIDILFKRKLYTHIEERLRIGKRIAVKYEKHTYLIELNKWKERLDIVQGDIAKIKATHKSFKKEQDALLNKEKNFAAISYHFQQYAVMGTEIYIARDKRTMKKYQQLIRQTTLIARRPLSLYARCRFYQMQIHYHHWMNDIHRAYRYCKAYIGLLEKHFHMVQQDPMYYITAVNRLFMIHFKLKKYDEMERYIQKLKKLSQQLSREKSMDQYYSPFLFTTLFSNQAKKYIVEGEFSKGLDLVENTREEFAKYEKQIGIDHKLILFIQVFYLYFGNQKYEEALIWINKILNQPNAAHLRDIQSISHILNIITHYELGHVETLEYLLRNTYRFLIKRQQLFQFEKTLLDIIRKRLLVINPHHSGTLTEAFEEIRKTTARIMQDPNEAKVFGYFDFIGWLDSKIEKRPFAEVVREKAHLC